MRAYNRFHTVCRQSYLINGTSPWILMFSSGTGLVKSNCSRSITLVSGVEGYSHTWCGSSTMQLVLDWFPSSVWLDLLVFYNEILRMSRGRAEYPRSHVKPQKFLEVALDEDFTFN